MISISPFFWTDVLYDYTWDNDHRATGSSWFGGQSRRLRLKAPVEGPEFAALLESMDSPSRPRGWRIEGTAPKTAASLWALAPIPDRKVIEAAHGQAFGKCLSVVENEIRSGTYHPRSAPCFGSIIAILPLTSSDEAPSVKTDALLINVAIARSCQPCPLQFPPDEWERMARRLTSVYRQEFCQRLETTLGLELVRGWGDPEIVRVPKSIAFEAPEQISDSHSIRNAPTADDRLTAWERQAGSQGWGRREANLVLAVGQTRKFPWFTSEGAIRKKQDLIAENERRFNEGIDELRTKSPSQSKTSLSSNGETAPHKHQSLPSAESIGWDLPEVKKLLEMGRRRKIDTCATRSESGNKLREIQKTEDQGAKAEGHSQSQNKSNSQGHSH